MKLNDFGLERNGNSMTYTPFFGLLQSKYEVQTKETVQKIKMLNSVYLGLLICSGLALVFPYTAYIRVGGEALFWGAHCYYFYNARHITSGLKVINSGLSYKDLVAKWPDRVNIWLLAAGFILLLSAFCASIYLSLPIFTYAPTVDVLGKFFDVLWSFILFGVPAFIVANLLVYKFKR